jgi:hypothetical protein
MPVAGEEPVGDGKKRVAFQPTPRMSSYFFVLKCEARRGVSGAPAH